MGRSPANANTMSGLLVVDKPLGWTSMDIVRRVRRAAGGAKTGHAGTLDPLATGVLVCCLGKATRCVERVMATTKVYEAGVDLAAFTSTDDREGEREEVEVVNQPMYAMVAGALDRFIGEIEQTPPAFSAVHVNGQRAYKLARRGERVVMPPRRVRIDSIELLEYEWPLAHLRVTCGKGVYIRSLARDLGVALGTGGHLASLRRLSVGEYGLDRSVGGDRFNQPLTQADLIDPPPLRDEGSAGL